MDLLLVGIGGALGSIARFKLGKVIAGKSKTTFPLGTFIVNITGAMLLGFVCSMGVGRNLYLLLADGFLGAYTTFSAFMYEGFSLFQGNERLNAIIYIVASLLLGLAGYVAGFALGEIW